MYCTTHLLVTLQQIMEILAPYPIIRTPTEYKTIFLNSVYER